MSSPLMQEALLAKSRRHAWDQNELRLRELAEKRDKRLAAGWDVTRAWDAYEQAKERSDKRMWDEIAGGGSTPEGTCPA